MNVNTVRACAVPNQDSPKFKKDRGFGVRGNEAVVNWLSRRDGDFAREPLRSPRETNLAPQVIGDHLFHHARAETLVRGWRDGGAVRLGPTQHESAVCRARPLHLNVALGYRQSPVLGG